MMQSLRLSGKLNNDYNFDFQLELSEILSE